VSPPIHPLASSQGAVFLINSCQRDFSCGPNKLGQALFRSYGCFFAEFLGDLSLVRLGLLDLTTCVGLRYGSCVIKLRNFSWKRALYNSLWRTARFNYCLVPSFKSMCGFTYTSTLQHLLKSNNEQYILHSVLPSHHAKVMEY
jgi:hypothetical protein